MKEVIKAKYNIKEIYLSDRLSEESKIDFEMRMDHDLGYLADVCGIDNRDIGLNGYAIAVNPPSPGQFQYGAWFYDDKVMGIMCSPDHRHCAFAHEWFHILDDLPAARS